MTKVTSKEQLRSAINRKESCIIIEGPLAEKLARQKKAKKRAGLASGLLIAGGLLTAPFTGGLSLMGATAGAAALSGAEIVTLASIASVTLLGVSAIQKDYDIEVEYCPTRIRMTKKRYA